MKIKRLQLGRLKRSEWFQFIKECCNMVEKSNPETLKVKVYYDKLVVALTTASDIMGTSSQSAFADDLVKIDRRREELFLSINKKGTHCCVPFTERIFNIFISL